MAPQILNRGQLKKMSNENISSFLVLQDNIILKQNDLLQQNREMLKKLYPNRVGTVAQNTSKVLQEAFKTINSKLKELERHHQNWNSI